MMTMGVASTGTVYVCGYKNKVTLINQIISLSMVLKKVQFISHIQHHENNVVLKFHYWFSVIEESKTEFSYRLNNHFSTKEIFNPLSVKPVTEVC